MNPVYNGGDENGEGDDGSDDVCGDGAGECGGEYDDEFSIDDDDPPPPERPPCLWGVRPPLPPSGSKTHPPSPGTAM